LPDVKSDGTEAVPPMKNRTSAKMAGWTYRVFS
jgi:hypothetical protein